MYTADAQKCTEFSIAALKLKWNDMVKTLTDTQKIDIVKNIIVDIARYSPDVSAQLKSAFLIVEAHNSLPVSPSSLSSPGTSSSTCIRTWKGWSRRFVTMRQRRQTWRECSTETRRWSPNRC